MIKASATIALTSAARTELLESLRPWLRVLRERTFVLDSNDMKQRASNDVLWLRLPATLEVEFRIFEAFELLALASGVDYELWRLALSSVVTGRTSRVHEQLGEGTTCQIGCVVSFNGLDEFPNAILAWTGRFAGADPETSSSEYVHVRDELENLYREMCKVSASSRRMDRQAVMVPVSIWVHEGTFEDRMEQLAQVADAQQQRRDELASTQSKWRYLFHVIEMDPGTPDVVTANGFHLMTEIASRGICIERLKPNGMTVTDASAATFARGLPVVFGDAEPLASEESSCAAVSIVELPVFLPPRTVTALFSALRTSRSVRTLALSCPLSPWQLDPDDSPRMTRRDRDHLWRWIAFAIFGAYADHGLHEIRINAADLTAEDMRAMRDQLNLSERVPVYSQGQNSSSCEVVGSAIASTFRTTCSEEFNDDVLHAATLHAPKREVLVVDEGNDEWLHVLVAGFGLAWVKTDTVVASSANASVRRRGGVHLVIDNMNQQSIQPVLEMLRLTGEGVTRLSIATIDVATSLDDSVFRVFETCPRLKDFSTNGRLSIRSMEVFTDMLTSERWQIETLQLNALTVADPRSLVPFFHALAYVTNATRQRLCHVQLIVHGIDSLESGVEIADAVGTVLRNNYTLRHLHVKLCFQVPKMSNLELWIAGKRLNAHHLEPICIRRAPLQLGKKLGFLSVLARGAGAVAGSCPTIDEKAMIVRQLMYRMDRPLISLVFAFAAECERRSVSVRLTKDDE